MTEEEIKVCETRFGRDEQVRSTMDMVEYDDMPYSQRSTLWRILAEHIKTKYDYVVPGTEQKQETEDEKRLRLEKQARESAEALRESVQDLKDIGVQRIYLVDNDAGTSLTCSVLNPLPAVKRACKMPPSGKLEMVEYLSDRANYKAVEFSDKTVGLATTAMGDCIGVMFLVGHQGHDGYWGGSLAHLPGGNVMDLPWKKMIFDLDADTMKEYLQANPLYAQALICLTHDRLRGSSTVKDIISDGILPLGFFLPQIMVYVGFIPGFGLLKTGAFGFTKS